MAHSYTPAGHAADAVVVHPAMSFRAVLAGWLIATGIAGLLYVVGLALGFSSFDAWHPEGAAKGIGIGSAIWVVLSWGVALLLGGLFASWFDAYDDQTRGALHGITVWGLSIVATGLWLSLGLAHAMHGPAGGPGMGDHRDPAPPGPAMMAGAPGLVLQANVAGLLGEHEREAAPPIVTALLAGQDDVAGALLAADAHTSQAEASQALQRLAPQVAAAKMQAKANAERAAHYTALTLWIAFLASFLGLLAAAVGGWLGSGHIHRVYHLRDYPARTLR